MIAIPSVIIATKIARRRVVLFAIDHAEVRSADGAPNMPAAPGDVLPGLAAKLPGKKPPS
jgi:hypothetical protein